VQQLDVRSAPEGGVTARATLHFLAPPAAVQAVLTDYERWPELFSTSVRVARVERYPGRAVTDLYLKHELLFEERRLLCENRELPGGGLLTTMLDGDFKRYSRTWKISPDGISGRTKAEFELLVEVDTWAPDWLVAAALKRELETHFRLLKDKMEERARTSIPR
jgi:ribosome-associated toxin RatA of RatAB toxin-antitoxin module